MKSQWTKTAALAASLAALGSIAYWYEYQRLPKSEKDQENAKRALNIEARALKRVSIESSTGRYAFECLDLNEKLCKPGDQSRWSLLEPITSKADDSTLNSMLTSLTSLKIEQSIDLSQEADEARQALLSDYGLSASERKLNRVKRAYAELEDGSKQAVWIGNPLPIGDRVYAVLEKDGVVDEKKVYLVSGLFKQTFEHDLNYWRDKRLVTLERQEISFVEYSGGGQDFRLSQPEGRWSLQTQKPLKEQFDADVESVETYLSAITSLAAKRFVAEDKLSPEARKRLTGAKLLASITFDRAPPAHGEHTLQPITLKVYEKKSDKDAPYLAEISNAPHLAEIDAAAQTRLVRTAAQLRMNRLIHPAERFTTKALMLKGGVFGKEGLNIVHSGQTWTGADGTQVMEFIQKVSEARIVEFTKGGAPSKVAATGSKEGFDLELTPDGDAKPKAFRFWMKNGSVFAKDLNAHSNDSFRMDATLNMAWPQSKDFLATPAQKPSAHPSEVVPPASIEGSEDHEHH